MQADDRAGTCPHSSLRRSNRSYALAWTVDPAGPCGRPLAMGDVAAPPAPATEPGASAGGERTVCGALHAAAFTPVAGPGAPWAEQFDVHTVYQPALQPRPQDDVDFYVQA